MLVMIVIFIAIFIGGPFAWHIRGACARREFYELRKWILDHQDDSTMSDSKWQELLPIARFADWRFRKLVRPFGKIDSCEELIRNIMGTGEEENAPK